MTELARIRVPVIVGVQRTTRTLISFNERDYALAGCRIDRLTGQGEGDDGVPAWVEREAHAYVLRLITSAEVLASLSARIRDRDLAHLDPAARAERLRELARATRSTPVDAVALDRKIADMERSLGHGTVTEVRAKLTAGTIAEDSQILDLLMLDRQRSLLTGR